ncbi:MAG TPA: terminase large subunit [Gemmataceae bacterium]|nr:terminase large subunit [Gemmataceae bacterium]
MAMPAPANLDAWADFLAKPDQAGAWQWDPTLMMRDLGLEPDRWQIQVLQANYRRALLNCCRQSGKSTTTAALALHHALYPPEGKPTLTLLLSPSLRQSSELFRKVIDFYRRLKKPEASVEENRLSLELTNGSRIVSLPSSEETVRGYSGVSLLIIDEAARVPDELYKSVRPMLAVSKGRLVCLSTPYGKRGFFYEAWHGEDKWERIQIAAVQCSRIAAEFLAEERRALGECWYRQEYGCEFTSMAGLVYPEFESCILDPCRIDNAVRAVAGCDFGWNNPSCFLVGVLDSDDRLFIVEEIYASKMTDEALALAAFELCQQWRIERVWCDSANPQSIEKLKKGNVPARPAFKAVTDGIRAVAARMGTGRLKVWRTCQNLIREAGLYHYDSERKLPTDEPVKEFDHAADALRYLVMGLDHKRHPHGMAPLPAQPEPQPPVDYETNYRVSPPPTAPKRLKTVEEQFDESEESRRLNREHLLENTFESWDGFGAAW